MILVDTGVWIEHVRRPIQPLSSLLEAGQIQTHPFVIGELSLGNIKAEVLRSLKRLPQATSASHREVMLLIERTPLSGTGVGYVDAHLLAAVRLTPDALLWTRDRRVREVAERMSIHAGGLD